MEARVRKLSQIAGMVIVKVGEDDVRDRRGRNAEPLERDLGRDRQLAITAPARLGVEARVDQDCLLALARHPDEIVERHGAVVHIPDGEVVVGLAVEERCVPDGVNVIHGKVQSVSRL